MGELLLCKEKPAKTPYYMEGIGWNIYTLEELCFYVEHNIYLLEHDFMTVELCLWIAEEIKNTKLAEKLYSVIQKRGLLYEFVFVLLTECAYSPKDVISQVTAVIREMEKKTDFEKNKMRADRLLEQEKYLSSIHEYRMLLAGDDIFKQSDEIVGSIWHNLGTAYVRMFLFAEGMHCYETAYQRNQNEISLKAYVMACYCYYDDNVSFLQAVESYHPKKEWIEEIDALKKFEQTWDNQKEMETLIFEWKQKYRKICRI